MPASGFVQEMFLEEILTIFFPVPHLLFQNFGKLEKFEHILLLVVRDVPLKKYLGGYFFAVFSLLRFPKFEYFHVFPQKPHLDDKTNSF